jgi:hypothetical protein
MDGNSSKAPVEGMMLDMTNTRKNYVILTGKGAKVSFLYKGSYYDLGESNAIKVNGSAIVKPVRYRGSIESLKLWIGRRWADITKMTGGDKMEDVIPNVAVGIRG